VASAGHVAHIKANPRRKELAECGTEHPPNDESSKSIHHPRDLEATGRLPEAAPDVATP
jgi:hypothetical protein